MKLRKLNQLGFDHMSLAVACVVIVGVIGTGLIVASHALSPQWKGVLKEGSQSSGFCLTTTGGAKYSHVVLDPCSTSVNSNQVWSLVNVRTATVLGAFNVQEFELKSSAGSNECLNNKYGSKTNGAYMMLYPCSSSDNPSTWLWGDKLSARNLSAHQLLSLASITSTNSLCLDDAYGSHATDNTVQGWTCKTTNQTNQNWYEAAAPTSTTGGGGSTGSGGSGTYTVSGNEILNPSGQQVMIHGVDRPSMEWSCNGQTVSNGPGPIPASDFTTMKSKWNANAVRVPMNQDFWLSGANKYCSSYQSNIATVVKNAQAAGLIVILDLHWSDKGSLANTSPGQQCMADQNSVTFWNQVASAYKSNPKVWFELYNEPHDLTWSQWLNGGSACGYQTVGMQQLYNAVRGTGATNIVVAGGNAWSSSLNGLPKISGNNIAYAIHLYRQTSGASFSTSGWDSQFGSTENSAPVIATEFGDQGCDGSQYTPNLLSYFRQHKVGYTAWAWWDGTCNFTSILSDPAGDCNNTNSSCAVQNDSRSYGSSPS